MKLLVLLALCGLAYGQFGRSPFNPRPYTPYRPYRPVEAYTPRPYTPYTPRPYTPYYPYRYTGQEAQARTLDEGFDIAEDGRYQYRFNTDNGIQAQQSGYTRNLGGSPPALAQTVQGSFSWTSPEGKPVSISYTADENGYRAVGDAIPTPPPIPDYILRSIEYNKAEEAKRARRF